MIADEASMAAMMRQMQAGERAAVAAVLHSCDDWLRRYFRRKIAPDRLDDLVQGTLISLHQKRASYDPARPFYPWLAAIARYRWVDMLRMEYRLAKAGAEDVCDDRVGSGHDDAVLSRLSLDTVMAHLSTHQREAIALVRIEGLTIREAADQTGQSESLVKINIHRGLRKLAALVEGSE